MSFSSVLQLLTNATRLRHEFGNVVSDALGLRTLYVIVSKLTNYIKRMFQYLLFGSTTADLEYAFKKTDSEMKKNSKRRSWWNTFLLIGGALWILRMLLTRISRHQEFQAIQGPPNHPAGGPVNMEQPMHYVPGQPENHMPFPDYPPPTPYNSFPEF
jgi:hypothetical protein